MGPDRSSVPDVLATGGGHGIALCGDVLFSVVQTNADPTLLEDFARVLTELTGGSRKLRAGMCVLRGLPRALMTATVRQRSRVLLQAQADVFDAFVLVIEGDARYLTAVRAAMNLLTRARQLPYAMRYEDSVEAGARWLSDWSVQLAANDIEQAVASVYDAEGPGRAVGT